MSALAAVVPSLVLAVVLVGLPRADATTASTLGYSGEFPDPFVLHVGGTYWGYATNGAAHVRTLRSTDLASWTTMPDALPNLPSWTTSGYVWAPSVSARAGRFVLYYTTKDVRTGLQCLSRAVGSTPGGPFVDTSTGPFICQAEEGGSIDASPFTDSDGTGYLIWKSEGVPGSQPTKIWSQRLSADGLGLVAAPAEIARQDQLWEYPLIEGPSLLRDAAGYHLLYAGNDWQTPSYAIGTATCASPSGPCVKPLRHPVLTTSGALAGPGGPETVLGPDGTLLLSYHSWSATAVGYPSGRRSLHFATLRFDGALPVIDEHQAQISGWHGTTATGQIVAAGDASDLGSLKGSPLNQPVVGIASRPSRDGYWLAAADGGVFSFGLSRFYGSTGGIHLNQPVTGIASTLNGNGYWLVARDGGIFSFGDAAFYGSTGAIRLNQPVVSAAPTPSGKGYWLVASDGGVFSFGDATFYGSTGAIHLNKLIIALTPTPSGHGYWLTASDGGIFAFGDAPFLGSTACDACTAAGLTTTPTGRGYTIISRSAAATPFGDASTAPPLVTYPPAQPLLATTG